MSHRFRRALAVVALGTLVSPAAGVAAGTHVVLGWNDLGMNFSQRSFADFCLLPPGNTLRAVVIERGDATRPPRVTTAGVTVEYTIEDNTYSAGKTDFWSWDYALFGAALPPDVGLAGKGLGGSMDTASGGFVAAGVPVTPYTDGDLVHEQPFQLARLTAFDGGGAALARTEIVTPVSHEVTCSACHVAQPGETVEAGIVRRHDQVFGTNLFAHRPVLCAICHASRALGTIGGPGVSGLSAAMHGRHRMATDDCTRCHPGPGARLLRGVMATRHGLDCHSCHGGMREVVNSIQAGREPWLEEPRCRTCHGAAYGEATQTLYRDSRNGHGGLFCAACHSSAHAILPSREERDDRQNVALQGYPGTLTRCDVCHGVFPAGPGPHGVLATDVGGGPAARGAPVSAAPNPASGPATIRFRAPAAGPLTLAVHDAAGREVVVLARAASAPGEHSLVWDGSTRFGPAPPGIYFVRLTAGGRTVSARFVRLGR